MKLTSCYNFISYGNRVCQFPKLSLTMRSLKHTLCKYEHCFRMTSQATISWHVAFLDTWKDDPIDRGVDGNFVFHFRFLILPFVCIFTQLFIHILLRFYPVHMCHVYIVRCINTNKTHSLSLWHSQFLLCFFHYHFVHHLVPLYLLLPAITPLLSMSVSPFTSLLNPSTPSPLGN